MKNLDTIKKLTAASAMAGFLGLAALSLGSGFAHAEPTSSASAGTNSASSTSSTGTNSTTDSASAGTNSATGSASTSDGKGAADTTTPAAESTTSRSSPSSKVGSEPTSSVSSSGGSLSKRWQDNATARERTEMRQLEDLYKQSLPGKMRDTVLAEYQRRLNDLQNRTSPPAP